MLKHHLSLGCKIIYLQTRQLQQGPRAANPTFSPSGYRTNGARVTMSSPLLLTKKGAGWLLRCSSPLIQSLPALMLCSMHKLILQYLCTLEQGEQHGCMVFCGYRTSLGIVVCLTVTQARVWWVERYHSSAVETAEIKAPTISPNQPKGAKKNRCHFFAVTKNEEIPHFSLWFCPSLAMLALETNRSQTSLTTCAFNGWTS